MSKESIGEKLSAAGYIAGWKLVRRMPDPVAVALFNAGADYASGKGTGPEMLRRNLTRVVGAENVTRELVRASIRSYARYWREAFRLPAIAGNEALMARLDEDVTGREYVDATLARGKGLILTLPHSGNWDMAGMWFVQRYGGFTTVAERLKPEVLFDAFVDYRQQLGFNVLAATGEKVPPYQQMKEVLAAGGVVCLMGERDMTPRGVPVSFFGEQATFPAGPAKLALETGAGLHVAHSWFMGTDRDPRWGLSGSPEVEVTTVEETTQRVADLFAANIAAHPQDWHALQPVFLADKKTRKPRTYGE
ncbi:phosphatidylinositol mannoside acyltransferase [Corynebacterium genitalium ATCC 33030]|uniref:Lipid A biosynthesis (KDO)2-(Lauroyl)-lipid IVA acyltransferase n=1 Tax=Corynebacterium genitalium ATCC 33030 TaxID=585529 RepID=D7WCE0_9CORY|nr:phosphatidylinositol mannoside acyltransferase [Corynebacterium genitalium]EFK53821.1 lipid A biosynthesis (KDO)2-(lauroyl)-lipid IVA acyltransferase [Corynebacterium genitalium ATCC 33030]UUA88621.1 phosphatidylinositol mannoside acyltransferase [Corynebacterium genitalium ATCC 33030]